MRRILIGLGLFAGIVGVLLGRPSAAPPVEVAETDPPIRADIDPPRVAAEVSWEGVDLDQVREVLPDNRYWTHGLPTEEPGILDERARVEEERQRMLGKVLSGNASEDEIAAYYDELQRINEDYAEFADHVLGTYRGALTDRDVGLLELASSMNHRRLAQLPDERLRAVVRKREQDRARAAWNGLQPGGAP